MSVAARGVYPDPTWTAFVAVAAAPPAVGPALASPALVAPKFVAPTLATIAVPRGRLASADGTLDVPVGIYTDCSGNSPIDTRSADLDPCSMDRILDAVLA